MDQPVSGNLIPQADSLVSKLDAVAVLLASVDGRQVSAEDFYMELVTFLQRSFDELKTRGDAVNGEIVQRLEILQRSCAALVEAQSVVAPVSRVSDAKKAARRKRLFISTGYFATAVAAALATQQDSACDDYLLITIDRQGAEQNIRWAYQMHDGWEAARTVGHVEFYEANAGLSNPFNLDFDDVYSAHFLTHGLLRRVFPADRYFFYEEGLTTYAEASGVRDPGRTTRFYALSPSLMRSASVMTLPVDVAHLGSLLLRSASCYHVPVFDGPRNVVLLATGTTTHSRSSRSASFEAFETVAVQLRAAGFAVWLRPHPRVDISDIFATSPLAAAGVRLLETDSPLIEPVILRNREKISAVVSVYSSFLIHSYQQFGIPAFSIAADLNDRQQAAWKALQDSVVPDVALLLKAMPDGIDAAAADFHNMLYDGSPKLRAVG